MLRGSNRCCSVPHCNSRSTDKIALHGFPSDITQRTEWLRVLNIKKPYSKYMRVCSLHFTRDNFIYPDYEEFKPYLRKMAMPSEKLPLQAGQRASTLAENKRLVTSAVTRRRHGEPDIVAAFPAFRLAPSVDSQESPTTPHPDHSLPEQSIKMEFEENTFETKPSTELDPSFRHYVYLPEPSLLNAISTIDDVHIKQELDTLEDSDSNVMGEKTLFPIRNPPLAVSITNDDDKEPIVTVLEYDFPFPNVTYSKTKHLQANSNQETNLSSEHALNVSSRNEATNPTDTTLNDNPSTSTAPEVSSVEKSPALFDCQHCKRKYISEEVLLEHQTTDYADQGCKLTCRYCKSSFNCKSTLECHLYTHEKAYKCIVCKSHFNTVELFKEHLDSQPAGDETFQCKTCELSFSSCRALLIHRNSHGGTTNKCGSCREFFPSNIMLKEHIASHEECRSFQCKICNRNFRRACNLAVHYRKHSRKLTHKCHADNCDESFAVNLDLLRHIKMVHNNESHFYRCIKCDDVFPSRSKLASHRATLQRCRKYQCYHCCSKFDTPAILKTHLKSHSSLSVFQCQVCNDSFKTSEELSSHRELMHESMTFRCESCNITLPNEYVWNVHRLSHRFHCSVCKFVYHSLQELTEHQKTHGEEKTYRCKQEKCKASFVSSEELSNHVLIHKKIMYKCSACSLSYKSLALLEAHLATHSTRQRFLCKVCNCIFAKLSDWSKHASTHGLDR